VTEISRHIVLLLLSNDCVIVPDFGGFMVHHIDAIYDEQEHLFYPPRQVLGFNPQLKLNDSLLAYSYAEAYDISFPEASQRLAADVEQLVAEIKANGSYEIDGIGMISLNNDGAYEFEPFEAGVLTPALYGLSSFAAEPIADLNKEISQAPQSIKEKRVEAKEESEANTVDDTTDNDAADYIRIPRKWLRYAAVACVAIFLIMLIPLPTTTIMETLRAGQMDSSLLYRMLPKASTSTPLPQLASNVVKTKPVPGTSTKTSATNSAGNAVGTAKPDTAATTIAPSKVTVTAKKPEAKKIEPAPSRTVAKHGFSIVLASKVSKANAESFVATIAKKGYPEGRVTKMSQGYRVVYGSYASQQEANAKKHQMEADDMFTGCWILETGGTEAH